MHQIDLFKPSVPRKASYLPYIDEIDALEMYSNFGPLYQRLRSRFATHLGLSDKNVELVSSGTAALIASLVSLRVSGKPYCLLPSWTFVATAQAVVAAGLIPVFLDVDAGSMVLTDKSLVQVPKDILDQTSVILVVAPFGSPLDLDLTLQLARRYMIEVLVDAAAAFESLSEIETHTVVSLHATKTLGIGEGGLVVSPSPAFIDHVHAYSNFGFMGKRLSEFSGVNLKLSEFACAIGLAALDAWSDVRAQYYKLASLYLAHFSDVVEFQAGWGVSWVSSVCVVKFKTPAIKNTAMKLFDDHHIACRDWWNKGCHQEPLFKDAKKIGDLHNTLLLSETTLGIPFHLEVTDADVARMVDVLRKLA